VTTVIHVEALRKAYGRVEAVRGIDFEVEEGEIFALLGPNGAGKTTTVEILEGYRQRTGGRVEVLGTDPGRGARGLRERIGIMLQEYALDPYLNVVESVRAAAALYPAPRPVDEVLDLVGLQGMERSRVKTLSGGQQRRLDLALALVGDPSLLFLDEPTTGFDPSARRAAWELVGGLRHLGKTVLLTTHYMDEAQHLADRVAVMVDGVIVALGTPDALGGRDLADARIRFNLPCDVAPDELSVPVHLVDASANLVEVVTEDPTVALHALTSWALARGVTLEGITVSRPSLEDVYLSLTEPGNGS
jgi:ABC-2 type transport system ATP-binding protein